MIKVYTASAASLPRAPCAHALGKKGPSTEVMSEWVNPW